MRGAAACPVLDRLTCRVKGSLRTAALIAWLVGHAIMLLCGRSRRVLRHLGAMRSSAPRLACKATTSSRLHRVRAQCCRRQALAGAFTLKFPSGLHARAGIWREHDAAGPKRTGRAGRAQGRPFSPSTRPPRLQPYTVQQAACYRAHRGWRRCAPQCTRSDRRRTGRYRQGCLATTQSLLQDRLGRNSHEARRRTAQVARARQRPDSNAPQVAAALALRQSHTDVPRAQNTTTLPRRYDVRAQRGPAGRNGHPSVRRSRSS